MKQKIKEAITQGYKNLGVPESVVDGLAALGVTVVKEESEIADFVQGEAVKGVMKSYQSETDRVRTEYSTKLKGLENEKAELEAKLNGNQTQTETTAQTTQTTDDEKVPAWAQAILDSHKALSDKLAGFEEEKAVNDTIATVSSRIDAWGYGKGYPKEMEKARRNAMELYEAYGKKWTPDELEAKIKEKFNMEVHDKGLDTSKPFESDGGGGTSEAEKNTAFAAEIRNALGLNKE